MACLRAGLAVLVECANTRLLCSPTHPVPSLSFPLPQNPQWQGTGSCLFAEDSVYRHSLEIPLQDSL